MYKEMQSHNDSFFLIQFNVPFKNISIIETSQSIDGRNGSTPRKPPDTPASRTCLVSHVASAGLEPTLDTDDRMIKSAETQRPYPLGHGGHHSNNEK